MENSAGILNAIWLHFTGWLSVRHDRHEQWPIINNSTFPGERCDGQRDGDTASVSSRDGGTRVRIILSFCGSVLWGWR